MGEEAVRQRVQRNCKILCSVLALIGVFGVIFGWLYSEDFGQMALVTLIVAAAIVGTYFVLRWVAEVSISSKKVCILMLLLFSVIFLLVCFPVLRYHFKKNYDPREDLLYTPKYRKTIAAFKSVWKRQNYVKAYVLPLVYLAAFVALITICSAVPVVGTVIIVAACVVLFIINVNAINGVMTEDVAYTTYTATRAEGFFDMLDADFKCDDEYYNVNTSTTVKEENTAPFTTFVLSLLGILPELFLIVMALLLFIFVNAISLILPFSSIHVITTDERLVVPDKYIWGSTKYTRGLDRMVNKLFKMLFGFSFVNKYFWIDQYGFKYIAKNLTDKNWAILEGKLNEIEAKYPDE